MEHQPLIAFHMTKSKGGAAILIYNRTFGRLSMQKWFPQHSCYIQNMNVNGASTILGLACWIIKELCDNINP
jgi:hypothetical protein